MTIKQWIGDNGTDGTDIAITVPAGSIDAPFNTITKAGAATLKFSSTTPPFAGMMSARGQAASGGTDRIRWYHTFTASDTVSERFYFRIRQDPNAANPIWSVIDSAGSFSQIIQLQLTAVSGVRHLQLTTVGAVRQDFGAITFGTSLTDWYRCECTATKGTTASNGVLRMKIFDSTGTLFGAEHSSTAANTGTSQFIRSQWGGNTGVLTDMDIVATLTDDNPVGYYPGQYVVPSNPPTMTLANYSDYTTVVASSAAGSGGTLSHTATPTAGLIEPKDGVFLFPRAAATGADYTATVTVTESPSGQTAALNATIPKLTAGGFTDITAPRVPSGTIPGNTWT